MNRKQYARLDADLGTFSQHNVTHAPGVTPCQDAPSKRVCETIDGDSAGGARDREQRDEVTRPSLKYGVFAHRAKFVVSVYGPHVEVTELVGGQQQEVGRGVVEPRAAKRRDERYTIGSATSRFAHAEVGIRCIFRDRVADHLTGLVRRRI
jgi:hypothetical protein